jgi:hypothetical protein
MPTIDDSGGRDVICGATAVSSSHVFEIGAESASGRSLRYF